MLSHIGRSTVAIGAFAAIVLGGTWISYPRALQAQPTSSNGVTESSLIKIGFNIAPVKLNLVGKNHALVGLGSFLVNAAVGCNHCHSAGPSDEWASNPYFGKPAQINPDTYLGGGNDFGQIGPPKHPFDQGPNIISRNLTPDKTGLPAGGLTLAQFQQIMRTGTDFDHLHPTCGASGPDGICLSPPFDGDLLQIMPWPYFKDMPDRYIRAIYEYLSTVPCIPGPPNLPKDLQNVCS